MKNPIYVVYNYPKNNIYHLCCTLATNINNVVQCVCEYLTFIIDYRTNINLF